jgi:hypothetical protein
MPKMKDGLTLGKGSNLIFLTWKSMFLTIYEGKLNIVKNIGTQIYKVCEIAFQLSVKKITYLTNEMVRIGALNCLQRSVLVNWH